MKQDTTIRSPIPLIEKRFLNDCAVGGGALDAPFALFQNVRHGGRFERLAAPLRKFIILSHR